MKPSVPAALRTLKASLEEHVIPELESGFARGQAGQIALTLEWLAAGWVEPLQTVRTGNQAIRKKLAAALEALNDLAEADGQWSAPRGQLSEALDLSIEDTIEAQESDRDRLTALLDELVIAAGVPVNAQEPTGALWRALVSAMEAYAAAETHYGPIPLPEEHWER
ncbi:MAG: hypothetical protein CMQ19_08480 [Gammaproteobacteria bacterium]|jgi:hypothetical protein|nr:hypothetical protein [Gammaproteobacteria bacterium]|tara:strand:- start:466 stop:963 length:498 start_codon:yes stop_codon:yes gene_type:complete